MLAVERVAEVLGGKAVLKRPVRTWGELEQMVRDGLPKRSLQLVASRALPDGEPASSLVYRVVPVATFKRRVRLTPEESARTERLARVVALSESIWNDDEETRAFLNRPHPLLDNRPPIEVASTELGARRVEQLLHSAEQGLPL
jgi:putative toxin-antitoxin system antitoxin component (TIGR02293 family)